MSLRLHRAARADALAEGLADLLQLPLDDPFATEVVVVPAKGMERWLSQRLSHRLGVARPVGEDARGDGVCAGLEFRTPVSLVAEITGAREQDPWSPETLVWPLLRVIDAVVHEPWAATLARHLGHGLPPAEADLRVGRRYAVARRLAALFASYAVQRPRLVEDWSAGHDTDGAGGPLDADLGWQPQLWRRLVAELDAPPPHSRHAATLARLRGDPGSFDLPERVSLFGHTRLPVTEIDLLAALAEHRDVHLWLPHPSPVLWDALTPLVARDGSASGPVPRAEDTGHGLVGHRLLATLGRDTRELQRALAAVRPHDDYVPDAAAPRDTLLGWLQSDLRSNAPGPAAERILGSDDRSVQVHACHGAARQVEVLREVLLDLLDTDPTLEPRDILVMCPDVETHAPLISAGFGLGDVVGREGHPAHRLRVQLADRSLTQTNPLLAVATTLLDLAGGRATASQVVDLAHAEPVRRRFKFSDDDLAQLADWVAAAGIRWAFDAEHRADFGLDQVVANTWQFGLDRVLAGVALSDDANTWLDRTLPLDDVGSGQVDLAGRVSEYVDRLRHATDSMVGRHPVGDWLDALEQALATLTLVPASDGWQSGQVHRELSRVREAAAADLQDVSLRLPDVRALLGQRLAGRPTRANFRTGTLTVCTMVPMRSVPHRVVCLLGLDDGTFPRAGAVDGDDVLARRPLTGERDPRSEDRQLLLDAILAATETLVVTYTGANEYSGQPRPPAVPLDELLDALDESATSPAGRVSEVVTVRHPLQSFDRRNVVPSALVAGRVFTFDRAALAGARAAAGPRVPPAAFLDGPLPALPPDDVLLDDLLSFFKNPARAFVRGRLDLDLPRDPDDLDELPDALPVELDHLEKWSVGDRVLRDLLAQRPVETVKHREWRRGTLPPGRLGWRLLEEIVRAAEPLARAGLDARTAAPRDVDVDVDLGGGRRLRGTVPGVYAGRLVAVGYSRLAATHRLQSWIALLALSAGHPDHHWTAHTIGRAASRSPDPVATSVLGPVDHRAAAVLADLVRLRDRGLCEPLPLPLKTSCRYATMRRTHANVDQALEKAGWEWHSARYDGEDADAAQVLVHGPGASVPGRLEIPHEDEEMAGENTRFGALALKVWSPLLDAEQGSW